MTRRFAVFIGLLSICIQTFAQDQGEKQNLRDILSRVETQYGVTFSFADENIEGIVIDPPNQNLTLEAVLNYLELRTGLKFNRLNERFISINKPGADNLSICGVILDNDTHLRISGATVQSKKKAAVSNENGRFDLTDLSEDDTLTIRFLGYASMRLPIRTFIGDTCKSISLKLKTTKLQEVVINNFVVNGINISSDGAIKIDANSLGILPGLTDPDVLQTIQAMPGIQSVSETVSDINVRGGTNDQNLILWDGIKMYQSGHFFGLISAFNPYLTSEVTLIKNGTPTSLSDGVSSTIDIRTDDVVGEKFSGGAGVNMVNADLFFKIPVTKNMSFQLSGRRSIADLYQTPTYRQYFNRIFRNTDVAKTAAPNADTLVGSDENFNFYDVTAKFLYNPGRRDKLRISLLRIYNRIDYEENAMISNELESKTSGLEQESLVAGISYRRLWNEHIQTNAQFYVSSYNLNAINFDLTKDQRLIQENKILDTGLKLDSRISVTNTFDLFAGYQFFEVGASNLEDINNPIYRRLIKEVLRSHSVFAEGNYSSKSNSTNLRVGLRANYFEKFNKYLIEQRLAFTQRFLSHFSFELLGETKSQSATQVIDLQNDFLGVEKRRWILANEADVPIVTSRQLSVGLRYQRGDLLLSLDGYMKYVDGITSSSQGFQNQFQYIRSQGTYDVTGLDLLINQKLGGFTTWLSYSFAVNEYEFSEFSPSVFSNNLDIRHAATFGSSYQTQKFQLSAGLNWRTGKPYTEGLGLERGVIIYDEPNSKRLDDYLRIDLSAKYWFRMTQEVKGEIGLSIWNLLDSKNLINTYYQADNVNGVKPVKQYALGFTPNLMLRISF